MKEIIEESHNNKLEAQRYLEFEINVSFPEIKDSIRTKRAAHNILSFQKYMINFHYKAG